MHYLYLKSKFGLLGIIMLSSITVSYAKQIDTTNIIKPDSCSAVIQYYQLDYIYFLDSLAYRSDIQVKYPEFINGSAYHFIDASGDYVDSREWIISDGSKYTDKEFIHVFEEPGVYEVCLRITYLWCFAEECITVVVGNPECEAKYSYEQMMVDCINDSMDCIGYEYYYLFTDISGDDVVERKWYIDNEYIGNYETQEYNFEGPGNYLVCLEILTESGCTDTYCDSVIIAVDTTHCFAAFEYFPLIQILDTKESDSLFWPARYLYQFVDRSSPDAVEWYWDFGTNTIIDEQNPVFEFPGPGVYPVCLYIITADGCESRVCKEVIIDGPGDCHAMFEYFEPIDSLDIEIYVPNEHGLLQFVDVSEGNITSWHWSFGDGTFSSEQNPMHYFKPGVYEVCLTIYSNNKCSDTYCEYIVIDSTGKCNAYFEYCSYDYIFPYASLQQSYLVGFKNLSIPNNAYYWWDLGDGTYSEQKNPIHEYHNAGLYEVCLQIWTESGCEDMYCTTINVGDAECTVDFNYNVIFPNCEGFEPAYNFFMETDQWVESYYWDFGDGEYSYEHHPMHIFTELGTFNVCLNVVYPDQCSAQKCKTIYNYIEELDSIYYKSCGITATEALQKNNGLSIESVYPVPAANYININISSLCNQAVQIHIVNLLGETVQRLNHVELNSGNNEIELDISNLSSGEYMYIISTVNKVIHGKVSVIK